MQQKLSIKQNMLWNSAGSLFGLACQWLTTVLVVRLSDGFDAAGALSLAMAISNIFQPLALYSMRSYQVSDVHRDTSAGEYVAFRLVTMLGSFAFVGLYAALTTGISVLPTIVLYLLFKCGDVFVDVLHGVDQQNMRMDYCGKSMASRGLLSLLAFAFGLSMTNSLEVAVALMCLSCLPIIAYDWKMASQFEDLTPHLSFEKCLALLRACLPAVVGIACSSAVISVARQKLGVISGQDVLGIYASVCTPVVIVQSCVRYIYAPLLGEFASKLARSDYKGYRSLFTKVLGAFFLFTVAGVIGFKLIGRTFLNVVFGSAVAEHAYLLDAATISVVLCALVSFLGDQLIALRSLWGVLWSNLAGLALSYALSGALIGIFGMNGTTIAVIVAYLITAMTMLVFLRQAIRRKQASR